MSVKLHTAEQLKRDLYALGLKSGDTLMMHSSYKSLGGIEGGAETIFSVLFEILGQEGTLVLPAFSYDLVTEENSCFDLQKTPVCVGYLPEYFRTRVPGVIRSMHATHSCCVKGKRAEELTVDHELDLTPVGENSPLARLPKVGGKILILGSHPDHNTTLHGVEEVAGVPYIFRDDKMIDYVLRDGEREIRQHAFRHCFTREGYYYEQKYERIIPLLSLEDYTVGKVLDADCYIFSAQAVWEKGRAKLKEDPYYFVNRIDD